MRSEDTRVLSVDVGSSSVRAELYDGTGSRVEDSETQLGYELEYAPDGGVTKDPDELLELVARAIDGALSDAGDAPISAVAMSTFWHSVVGLDHEGRPTTPVLYWADRRAAGAARELREGLPLLPHALGVEAGQLTGQRAGRELFKYKHRANYGQGDFLPPS